jgi:hypothetical protein
MQPVDVLRPLSLGKLRLRPRKAAIDLRRKRPQRLQDDLRPDPVRIADGQSQAQGGPLLIVDGSLLMVHHSSFNS